MFFPFYNERENIERVVGEAVEVLGGFDLDYEVILVDDGSGDGTGDMAEKIALENERVRVVRHEVNKGYGAALRSGFAAASKEWVFYTDGDGQFDFGEIGKLIDMAGSYDIISGYRENRQDGPIRRLNALGWGTLTKAVLGFRVRDVDCAFKLYRRAIFDRIELKSTGALIDAEILARAKRAGFTIGEVGVRHLPRRAGEQTGANIKVILRAFKELFRLRREIVGGEKG